MARFEFRPTTLVSLGQDGREHVLTRVEYRGGGDTIAVLPLDAGSFGAAVFDFKGHDKIIAKEIGCTMVRAGAPGRLETHRLEEERVLSRDL